MRLLFAPNVSKRTKRNLPAICLDEHISPAIAAVFARVFRIVRANRDRRFKGRDERSYIGLLYAENAMFVTSDQKFLEELAASSRRHAGALYIPKQFLDDEKVVLAEMASGYIQGACIESRSALRKQILYAGYDGMRTLVDGKDRLDFSWDHFDHIVTSRPPDIARRTKSRRARRQRKPPSN